MSSEAITVVSGLPRSGTSMMMKVLEAGGLGALTDEIREADEDNPKGYYELEAVKDEGNEGGWIDDARGKAVKVISALLKNLPKSESYKVIFMRRKMDEILASQKKMLVRRGEPTDRVSDEEISKMFFGHIQQIEKWLADQPNIEVLYVNYNEVLKEPEPHIAKVHEFLSQSKSLGDYCL